MCRLCQRSSIRIFTLLSAFQNMIKLKQLATLSLTSQKAESQRRVNELRLVNQVTADKSVQY